MTTTSTTSAGTDTAKADWTRLEATSGPNVSGIPGVELPGGAAYEVGDWVVLQSPTNGGITSVPALVRKVHPTPGLDTLPEDSNWPNGEPILADLVLRLGLGVGGPGGTIPPGTQVRVIPPKSAKWAPWDKQPRERKVLPGRRQRLVRWLVPTVNVLAVPQKGELTLAEQNAVVLEELSIDALGINSGDEVILTVVTRQGSDWALVQKTVKAYQLTDQARERRRAQLRVLGSEDTDAPPRECETRTKQTLPRVWMGGALREQLGVGLWEDAKKPGAPSAELASQVVLIAPSRRYAFIQQLGGVALVVAIGLPQLIVSYFGWTPAAWALIIAGSVVIPVGLLVWMIRTKLR